MNGVKETGKNKFPDLFLLYVCLHSLSSGSGEKRLTAPRMQPKQNRPKTKSARNGQGLIPGLEKALLQQIGRSA